MDWKLELLPAPVTDIDHAIAFYFEKAAFASVSDEIRFVQLTRPCQVRARIETSGV